MREENRYFQEALANFTQEAANGGAIRHLADLGYTVKQITERLDFPAPYEKVRQAVWEHLIAAGVILREEPGSGGHKEEAVYVKEYDRYGKATFRRVVKRDEELASVCWRTGSFSVGQEAEAKRLLDTLRAKLEENGEESSYASCDFGLTARADLPGYESLLQALDGRTREYVSGLPWERQRVYHRLNARMMAVLGALCGKGLYHGECFFLKTGDRIRIERTDPSQGPGGEYNGSK